jgi:hypothetical protein
MKRSLFIACALALAFKANAQTYSTVPVTGYNADVVAEGTGAVTALTTQDVDGAGYNFMAAGYTNPAAVATTRGLPATGLITTAVTATPGLTYQLAALNANNSLRISGAGNGTLTFPTATSAEKVYVLATSGSGASVATITVTFTDATTQVFTQTVNDWYGGTNFAIQGIGRVNRTSNGIDNNTIDPRLYQFELALNQGNTFKPIQSISFANTGAVLNVMGISIKNSPTPALNDAGISAVTAPVSPVIQGTSQPVRVTLVNQGTTTLTSATITWTVNSVAQTPFLWTGSLAFNQSATVTIGNFTFPNGNHTVNACATNPNNTTDGFAANDCAQTTLAACNLLSGTFTIDKNNPATATSFQSITAAIAGMSTCGVSGPVIFNVAPTSGPYAEQVDIPAIPGASATNTITFNGNGNTVSADPASATRAIFKLNGADYVTINNFIIATTGTGTAAYGWGVHLMNGADNNTISNNTINIGSLSTTESNSGGIVFSNSTTSTLTTGNNGNNNVISGNTINGGYNGILLYNQATSTGNNQITGNTIKDFYATGIKLGSVNGTLVENNNISRPTRVTVTTFTGIELNGTTKQSIISKNRIHTSHGAASSLTGTAYGVYSNSNAAAVGAENIVKNNTVYNFGNTGTAYGLYNSASGGVYYYHNTVNLNNTANTGTVRGFYQTTAANNIRFLNNNINVVSGTSGVKHAIYYGTTTSNIISNFNNLYQTGGATGSGLGFFTSNRVTLADWRTGSGDDSISVSSDPIFANAATGNLLPTSGSLNNIGRPVTPAVADDITGAARNVATPDPGAYEFTPTSNDVGVSVIITPTSGCGLTNLETVSVTLNNFGTAAQTNIPVTYSINGGTLVTETFTGTLAAGTSTTFTFTTKANLAVPGTYTIVSGTTLTTDALTANDAVTKVITGIPNVTAFPYFQNFEAGNGGWTASGTNSSWALGTPAKTIINSAASGTKAWVTNLTGQYNASENSLVLGPCFNFSSLSAPVFEAKIWWNSEASWDGAVLQSSIDGGATWQVVGAYQDPINWYNDNSLDNRVGGQSVGWGGRISTSNGSGAWVAAKHALTGLGGQSAVMLRIAFGSDASGQDDGFAFDDVSIYQTPANDVELVAITAPANSGCGFTAAETVTVTIKNNGTVATTPFPVTYQIGTATAIQQTVTNPIAPGATATFSFTTTANFSVVGTYTITATTLLTGDGNPGNDSKSKTITVIPTISTLPYTEGFENGNGGWVAGGTNSSWALGTPAKTVINSAGTGTKSWVTNLTGQYNASENSQVVGPCFNFAGKPDPDFEMKAWWSSEASWDGAVLQSSINGGTTWQVVGAVGDPNNWYNDNSLDNRVGGQSIGWAGRASSSNGSGGWVRVKHKLNGLGGQSSVLLRIAFGSDASVLDDGFAFDDIRIGDNTNNLSVNSFTPLTKLCGFGSNEQVQVQLENLGSIAASGYTVSYTVNNGTTTTTPVTQSGPSLAPGVPTLFTFTTGANLSAPGSYTIVVTVNMTGDPEAGNDVVTYTISNASFTSLPPVFNFEPTGAGVSQVRVITKPKSNITENTGASSTIGPVSTKGMIMDGIDQAAWLLPVGVTDPWTNNPDNFSAAYICFNPATCATADSMILTLDLKQLFKTANANTNFRVTINGTQVGPTYRPPFDPNNPATPNVWRKIRVDLSQYKGLPGLQIGLESNVKEAYANGTGTANLVDNIMVNCVTLGIKENALAAQLNVFPNPSNGIFNVNLPAGKAYTLEVMDLTGKTIQRQSATGNALLKLENTAKGIYLLKVTGEGNVAVRKLIVE